MEDKNNVDIIKEIAVENSKEIYSDVRPIVQEASGAISTLVGWFNNVVLYPVKKANISFIYKLENFERDLRSKVESIPTENRIDPSAQIAGPILENMRYKYDIEKIRKMYINLLSSSMDSTTSSNVHPSYVNIIDQLTPDEAKILEALPRIGLHAPLVDIGVEKPNRSGIYTYYRNISNLGYKANCDFPDRAPIYIDNMIRLGLVEIPPVGGLADLWRYKKIKQSESFIDKVKIAEKDGFVVINEKKIGLTDYGMALKNLCLDDMS